MEVLISMFVAMIGLLGVAALIPLGHYEISEGTRAEYASALGRAAYRNFKIRGALEPATWYDAGGYPLAVPTVVDPLLGRNPNNPLQFAVHTPINIADRPVMFPVVIDPLGLGRGLSPIFPAAITNNNWLRDGRALARITVLPGTNAGNNRVPQVLDVSRQVGEQMFRGQDDLLFDLPDDGDKPPTQFFSSANSKSRRVALGEYSWLVTLVPHGANPPLGYPAPASVGEPYNRARGNTGIMVTMSIVVFHRRVLGDPNRELAVRIDSFPGGGVGGGDIVLDTSGVKPELRIGQWIMATGVTPSAQFYRWYRVIAAEDPLPGVSRQQVTLSGPDMPPWLYAQNSNITNASAWIIDGVEAVYEKHFRLEGPSIWAN